MVSEGVIEGVRTDRGVRIKRVSTKGEGGWSTLSTVADPDPQTRGAIIKTLRLGEGPGLKKIFFRPFRSQFGLKIRGAPRPPGPLLWIRY